MKLKRTFAVLFAAALMFFITSCRQEPNQQTVQQDNEIVEFQPASEIKEGRKNIYLIVKNLESSYWKVIINSVGDAGNDMDCNVYYSGTASETEWEKQEKLMDKAKELGADAVLLAPDDSVNLSSKVSEMNSFGMPVILVDTVVNTQNYQVCYMTDNLMASQEAAKEMIYQLKKDGVDENEEIYIAIQVGATSSQTINERLAGFCKYWNKNAPPKWKIIDEVKCNEGDVDAAVKCSEDFFKEYSKIKGVFGTNNGSTVGFAKDIKANNRTDIIVVGFDYSSEIAGLISDKNFKASTILQKQYDMGYKGVQTALDVLNNKPVSDIKFIDTGVVVVNSENLNDSEIQEILKYN